jgi:isoleucyl-tRNA synthetase
MEIISTFEGKSIEGTIYENPIYDIKCPVILAEYVSNSDGTGLVHNAPGFGQDDYLACKKYGIKPFAPINAVGKFTEEAVDSELVGLFYKDANDLVITKLRAADAVVSLSSMTHSVACD